MKIQDPCKWVQNLAAGEMATGQMATERKAGFRRISPDFAGFVRCWCVLDQQPKDGQNQPDLAGFEPDFAGFEPNLAGFEPDFAGFCRI